MSERYTRLFSLPDNIGQDGCPVLISAGALLKDNNTGKVLVQLKLRNISEQVIQSVKVKINAYDTTETSLKGIEAFSYLDLAVEQGSEFGSKTPIALPDKTTRSVSVEILSVVYGHGDIYQSGNNAVASSIDNKTQEKVRILNHEREEKKKQNEQKMQRKFMYVAFLPFIMYILAVFLYYMNYRLIFRTPCIDFVLRNYWRLFLFALIVPFMCLLSSRAKHNQIKLLKLTLSISVAFVFIQFLCLLYRDSVPVSIDDNQLVTFIKHRISGFTLLQQLKNLVYCTKSGLSSTTNDLIIRIFISKTFSEAFFLLKNITAILITLLQVKESKKQISERIGSK